MAPSSALDATPRAGRGLADAPEVSFNDNAKLDPSEVQDVRGSRMGGGGLAVGGGGIGIVILIAALLFGFDPTAILNSLPADTGAVTTDPNAQTVADCKTGADANKREDCRIVGYVDAIQQYWKDELAKQGAQYTFAPTVLYTDQTQAGCGTASAQMGPFYCPVDGKVYLDLSFFTELQDRFGAKGGPWAEAYVVAHEYGHHVQDLTGTLDQAHNLQANLNRIIDHCRPVGNDEHSWITGRGLKLSPNHLPPMSALQASKPMGPICLVEYRSCRKRCSCWQRTRCRNQCP